MNIGERKNRLFVTVGTTEFDSLIRKIVSLETLEMLAMLGYTDILLQIGNGEFEPDTNSETEASKQHLPCVSFYRLKNGIQSDIEAADLVISHAGAGSILDTLGAGKPLLVVVNEELMGNHQTEVAEKLAKDNYLYYCGVSSLVETLKSIKPEKLVPFPPDEPEKFAKHLDKALGFS